MADSSYENGKKWWEQSAERSPSGKDVSKWWMDHLEHGQSKERAGEINRLRYFTKLRVLQVLREGIDPFPGSDARKNALLVGLTAAQSTVEKERELSGIYEKMLKPYVARVYDKEKCDMKDDIGHKVHLNVEPSDVVRVSEYLKREGFFHKYLSGGEVLDGKVFTVYFGSKDMADRYSLQISRDLRNYLRRPIPSEEVEYAPNVVGRFVGDTKDFMQYGLGVRGVSVANKWADFLSPWQSDSQRKKMLPLAFEDSFNTLATKYGTYFYGSHEVF